MTDHLDTPPAVELLEVAGTDEGIALSAWTSTSRDLDDDKRARIPALLRRLWQDEHHTPFEKSYFRFLLRCDKATEIHLLKHRIGVSVNGESARYKALQDPQAHIPADWPDDLQAKLRSHFARSAALYAEALGRLGALGVSRQRAKESARFFLPLCLTTTLDVSFNWRSFLHFLTLRASPHAQREVHGLALAMLDAIEAHGGYEVTCQIARDHLAQAAAPPPPLAPVDGKLADDGLGIIDGLDGTHRRILHALSHGPQGTAALIDLLGVTRSDFRSHADDLVTRRFITATKSAQRTRPRLTWSLRQDAPPPDAEATPEAPPPIEPPRSPSVHQVPPLHASPARAMRERIAAAKRRAADRAAITVEAGGLRWTVRPVTEIKGAWEIVESTSPDDRRIFGEDVARRRLARLASEGRLPARTDGLTPSQKEPRP